MSISVATDLDYLLPFLRLQIGDIDSTAYRYLDEWLRTALVASFNLLGRWWNYKYLIDDSYVVTRNPNHTFLFPAPPVIQRVDDRPIVLMSSIIIKGGSLEGHSWNLGSWRDSEIAYSNIEGGRAKRFSIEADWQELTSLLQPPSKRLAQAIKNSLVGYKDNQYEKDSLF